jgi:hypothetical protein
MSAAIPARAFKVVSPIIFLRRSWKILQLTTSIRRLNHHVNAQYSAGPVPRPLVASIYGNESDSDRQPPRFGKKKKPSFFFLLDCLDRSRLRLLRQSLAAPLTTCEVTRKNVQAIF